MMSAFSIPVAICCILLSCAANGQDSDIAPAPAPVLSDEFAPVSAPFGASAPTGIAGESILTCRQACASYALQTYGTC